MDAERVAAARAIAFASRHLERQLGDLTLPQFRVLSLLADSPERASRVAERAAVSRPSLSGILDGLEARKLIRRHRVTGDRRGVRLEVTAAGRRTLARAEAELAAALDELTDELEQPAAEEVVAALVTLGTALRRRHDRRVAAGGATP